MKKLKKILLLTASSIAIITSTLAAEDTVADKNSPKINISAYADFQAGVGTQNRLTKAEKNIFNTTGGVAFYNSAAVFADISNDINGITYGGKIVLVPTAKRKSSPSYNGSHIYVKTEFGRIELGSPVSPVARMVLDGSGVAAAGFGEWDRHAKFATKYLMQKSEIKPQFSTFAEFFFDNKLVTKLDGKSYTNEPVRRIAYYTPKIDLTRSTKLQGGISYAPDSKNTGASSPDINSRKDDVIVMGVRDSSTVNKFEFDQSVKDAVSAGMIIEKTFSDGVDLKIALTGEHGKTTGKIKRYDKVAGQPDVIVKSKLSNLRTYNIGAILSVGNFSYAGSLGSLGKSLTTPEYYKTGRATHYYGGTFAYKQGPFLASVSYFKSSHFKNIVDTVSLGTHYLLAPGFKPYAGVSGFKLKGRPEYKNSLDKRKTRGTIALIGAKLSL
ncbi:MAG: porin [PVC group bacterium]|nr:porin [PVC group bacterium]